MDLRKSGKDYTLFLIWMIGAAILSACVNGQLNPVDAGAGEPQVIFMSPVDAPELWRVPLDGGEAVQLTQTGGNVFDFAASRHGIVYSVANETGGHDLWLLEDENSSPALLMACGQESCKEASWSPDGEYFAFTRGLSSEPTVWVFSLRLGEAVPLIDDLLVLAHMPSYSPDGRRIAMVEWQTGQIRILDLQDGENFRLPGIDGLMGSWSPDGSKMMFLDTQKDLVFAGVDLYVADLQTQVVKALDLPEMDEVLPPDNTDEDEHGHEIDLDPGRLDLSVPVWHPTENVLLIAQRPYFETFSKQLWVVPLDGETAPLAVTDDHNYSHAAYSWSPDGGRVVYQRFALELSDAVPQVWVWERESGEAHLLADNAALPQWLP